MILNRPNILNRLNVLNGTGGLPPTPMAWKTYSDTSLTATPASDTAMDLAWTNPVIAGVTLANVVVEISTDGVTFATSATLGAVTSTQVTGLTAGTLYYFRLVFVSSRGVRTGNGGIVSATTFVAAAQAYFAAMTTQLTTPQKQIINTLMASQAATIAKADCILWDFGTEQRSLIYMNDPSKSATKVNSPTYEAFKGWKGDASNQIDTNFNPSVGTNNIAVLSGCLMAYVNNIASVSASSPLLGQSPPAISGRVGIGSGSSGDSLLGNYLRGDAGTALYPDRREFLTLRRQDTYRIAGINKEYTSATPVFTTSFFNSTIRIGLPLRTPLTIIGGYLTDQELLDFQDAALPVLEYFGQDYWSNFTPTTLTATAGTGKIDLAWTLPITTYSPYTVTNVVIQESTDNVTFTDLTTLGAVTSHSVTVPTGQTRYYKIRYVSSRNIHTTNSAEAHATAV